MLMVRDIAALATAEQVHTSLDRRAGSLCLLSHPLQCLAFSGVCVHLENNLAHCERSEGLHMTGVTVSVVSCFSLLLSPSVIRGHGCK